MEFKEEAELFSYETKREGGEDVIYFNYLGAPFVPNLADQPQVMSKTIDALIENPNVSRIVFVQQKNYNYDFEETIFLLDIAHLYVYLLKQERILSPEKLGGISNEFFNQRYNELFSFLLLLKQDPIAAYSEIKKILINAKILLDKLGKSNFDQGNYISLLEKISNLLKETKLLQKAIPHLEGYQKGSREIYFKLFKPDVIANFTFTRLVAELPDDAEIVDQYEIFDKEYDKSVVTILRRKDEAKLIYHLNPSENSLSEDQDILLNMARKVLIEHQPKAEEFTDTERTRQVFFNISKDLIRDLAEARKINLNYSDLNKLATILVRHTIGFGLIEVLLQDKNLQDVVLNAPISLTNIFLRHQDYDECSTNILPSQEDVDSWAAKFRMISGRPLDEANPILDTQFAVGNVNARVAIIQEPLSPGGLAYAIRRHRESPWTLPLFIQNKMLEPLAAGLLSFLIDGSRTMLVAGTRSSGKTSLLGSLMQEIIPKYRVITVEDSVTGDSKIIVKENGSFRKTTIGEFIDEKIEKNGFIDIDGREKELNLDNSEIFSVNKEGKIILSKPTKFIRHKVNKPIYEIITTSGKKIKVTEDHSLFTLNEKNILKPIKCKVLKEGNFIAIPSKLPFNNSLDKINLLGHLNKLDKKIFIFGRGVTEYIEKNKKELFSLGCSLSYHKSTVQNWIRKKILPIKIFEKIKGKIDTDNLFIKSYNSSKKISCDLILDENFLSFIGLWFADGCYDKNSVIISVQEEENREVVRKVAERFNLSVKIHSDKFSLMLNSVLLKEIMQKVLGLIGNSYSKKIPSLFYNLSDKQVGALLKGFFSGDGCASDKEIVFSICSKELIEDITTMLLRFNIVLRVSHLLKKDNTFNCRIGDTKMIQKFKEDIGFLVNSKQDKLEKLCLRVSTHDTSDVIPLTLEIKEELNEILGKKFNKHDYITRQNNLGRKHLAKLLSLIPEGITNPIDPLRKIIKSDIFWDKVKDVRKVNSGGFVFDISVPECENFICENIVAHNTLELPVETLRKLKYDILRMKVRSSLLNTTAEVTADEGIRASLRLGDSSLIIGEIRSSLRGDQEVVVVDNGITKRIPIKDIENIDVKKMSLPTLTKDNKMELKPLSGFVKHPKRKKLIKLITNTGREVVVTPDHSVFTHVNFKIAVINSDKLKVGDPIVIPSKLPCGFNDIDYINLLEIFKDSYRLENAEDYIRKAIKVLGWKKASKICKISDIYRYLLSTQKTRIPISSFLELMKEAKVKYDINDLRIKKGTSNSIPAKFPINENTLRLIGYYLAEGNIDKNKIQITNSKPKIIEDIEYICKNEFGLNISKREIRGYGTSVQMHIKSKPLLDLLRYLGCGKTSFYKRIPPIVYGLSERKICALLKGMYSGDGSMTVNKSSRNLIRYFSTSKKLVEDVAYALLCFGIVCKMHSRKSKIKHYREIFIAEIKKRKYVEYFLNNIGFTHKKPVPIFGSFSNSSYDSIVFDSRELEKHIKLPRKYRHLRRIKRCSKDYLKKITEEVKCSDELYDFAHGDFFIDKVKSIEEIDLKKPEYVYDLSVNSTQRFVGGYGGILLHNTEAKALYEAMRVGALANVVAGTIHGASPYAIFDRVVNDLEVPVTSFKATDIIVVCNPIKTPDGLHSWKRVVSISEVRKHWTKDPLQEKGFVDLMRYNVEKDVLEPTADLMNGESEIIKDIASNVRGWAGNWDAVWDNILLRAKIKKEIVDVAEKLERPELLEAGFNVMSNNAFHEISDRINSEFGLPIGDKVFSEWQKWLNEKLKAKRI